jgi:hypothetical protein
MGELWECERWIGPQRYSDFFGATPVGGSSLEMLQEEPKGLLSGGLSRQLKRQGQAPERYSRQPCPRQ